MDWGTFSRFEEFRVDETDSVQIYDGSSANGVQLSPVEGFRGRTVPRSTFSASSGDLLLRFRSDPLRNDAGWRVVFSADCPELKLGERAIASTSAVTFGTSVEVTCADGQEFATGVTKISTECLTGGNWSTSYIPKCQDVYCGPVPQIDNGFAIAATNVTFGGEANYQCYAGFGFPSGQGNAEDEILAEIFKSVVTLTPLSCFFSSGGNDPMRT